MWLRRLVRMLSGPLPRVLHGLGQTEDTLERFRLLVGLVTHQATPREAGGSGEEDERSRIVAFSVFLIQHLFVV